MAIEQKERYIIEMVSGEKVNALCQSFRECLDLYGEENIVRMEKLPYEEPEE